MPLIDLDALNNLLDDTEIKLLSDRDHAASKEFFDKAAKLDHVIDGIKKSRFIANSGDCHIKLEVDHHNDLIHESHYFAYIDILDFKSTTGASLNEAFRDGWKMARLTRKQLGLK